MAATTQTFDAQVLNVVLPKVYATLTGFAGRSDFGKVVEQAFGTGFDGAKLEGMRQQWLAGDFSGLPSMEILPGADLQGANAAYAGSNNTIYVSTDFLNRYAHDSQALSSVLLEEIGHSVDWHINTTDTPGDEGELFSNLVQGINLSPSQIQQMKQENDYIDLNLSQGQLNSSAIINLGDSSLGVEKSGLYSSTNKISPSLINTLLVFGKNPPSTTDYNSHIRSNDKETESINYNLNDYMLNGGGRYAYPSLFPVVQKFFDYQYPSKNEGYTEDEIRKLAGLGDPRDYKADVSQYSTDPNNPDFAERSFIFGSTSFKISSIKFHVSSTGDRQLKV